MYSHRIHENQQAAKCAGYAVAITFNVMQRPDLAVAGLIYAVIMPAAALGFVAIARCLLADEVEVARVLICIQN